MDPDIQQNLDEAASVRYLAPEDFALSKNEGGSLRMTLKDDRSYLRIKTRRIFPFTYPTKYVSVRDLSDEEIGIISDLASLSPEYRRWIEDDIDMRYFTPRVKTIKTIKRRWGGFEWYVITDHGAKKVITKGVHDTMSEVQPGRYIITDVDGNRYELYSQKLDDASREILERLV